MPCANHPEIVTGLAPCSRCAREFCHDCVISLRGEVVCSACKKELVQDVKSGIAETDLDLAGRGARLASSFIDGLVIGIPIMAGVVLIMLPTLKSVAAKGSGVITGEQSGAIQMFGSLYVTLIATVVVVSYEALMLAHKGQTLGKMLLKIKVVRANGEKISAGQAWGRGLSRVLMQITRILGLIDILYIFSKERTTLHDRICNTRVVNWKR